ncbi:MAG: flagellar motor protein MotB, partial [Deltaproteobacteria bacterium]
MRKKKPAEHVNHERWLISYADFITLLFAFFVVMFAVSQVDSRRVGRFTEAFSRAVGINVMPGRGASVLPGAEEIVPSAADRGTEPTPSELEGLRTELETEVRGNATLQGLQIIRRRTELVLRLPDDIFFDSGESMLRVPAVAMLRTIATTIAAHHVDLRVEGHTDD